MDDSLCSRAGGGWFCLDIYSEDARQSLLALGFTPGLSRWKRRNDENKFAAIKCNQSHKRHFSFLLINFPSSRGPLRDWLRGKTAFSVLREISARRGLMPSFAPSPRAIRLSDRALSQMCHIFVIFYCKLCNQARSTNVIEDRKKWHRR